MKKMSLQDCVKMRDGRSFCVILVSEDMSFFIPLLVEGDEGQMLANFVLGKNIDEKELDHLLFIPNSWEQLDSNMIAVELDFDSKEGVIVAHTCMHQKNEISNKFSNVVTPIGYALIYSEHFNLPLYVDDVIAAQDGRDIQRLEKYIKNV